MKVLVAHPGTQHAHHLVSGLINAGIDVNYHTIMQFGYNSGWKSFLPNSLFDKRSIKKIDDKFVHRYPLLEGIPQMLHYLKKDDTEAYAARNRMFQKKVPLKDIQASTAVVGFDSSSLVLEKKCMEAGVPFFLELTTPHSLEKQSWSRYVKEKFPQWPSNVLQKAADLIRDEDEEAEKATFVSAPSKYVAETHYKYSHSQREIVINPYGADVSTFRPKSSYRKTKPAFAFMGVINAAKGLPVLLEAWQLAKPDATLTIAGHGSLPPDVKLPGGVDFVGSVQKQEREKFYHAHDVLVCPSLYEGLALVQLEAAACGLAVIGTHNSGGKEFLEDGLSGLFVDAGDASALAEKISGLASNADLRGSMGRNAAARVQEYTWDAYADRWIQYIVNNLHKQPGR